MHSKALDGASGASGGQHHSLVLKDGALWSCGRPTYGRLGRKDAPIDTDEPVSTPAPVDGLEGVKVRAR